MDLGAVSPVDVLALTGGDVPLPDGGVGGARVDVAVVHCHTRDVTSVAPETHIKGI